MHKYHHNNCAVACLILLSIGFSGSAAAHSPTGRFDQLDISIGAMRDAGTLLKRQPLKPRRIPHDFKLSERMRLLDPPIVTRPDNKSFRLPLMLDFRVSENRQTVVQFGDALLRMHPVRTDIFWIGDDGKVHSEVRDRFDGKAMLDMSDDGYLAVAGGAFLSETKPGAPKTKQVVLYDPAGEIVAEGKLEAKQEVTQIVALSRGRGLVFSAAPAKDPLSDNRLVVLRDGKQHDIDARKFGIVQKILDLADGGFLFVQGSDGFGLVRMKDSELIWFRPETIRLVGPHAAAMDPDMKNLFLMTGTRVSDDALYAWTLSILETETGKGLGQQKIDGQFPGTADPVFFDIKGDSVVIQPGDKKMRISIRAR